MQARRPSGVSPLAILLPHPPLPRRRSSLLSTDSSSPRTPRSCNSPTCSPSIFFMSANRKSTDSWNSSNQDELDCDWKPEQTLLLSRTLDALPAHLLTPFNGPVPPSNLLDKIARGVANAKGPVDWPHSIRATRVKLMELARVRAKEAAQDENSGITIAEEDDSTYSGGEVLQQTTNTTTAVPRRPLYRQSSMDFMNTAKTDLKDNDNIARLSNRLQRTDRLIPNPGYHPYSRPSLHRSPRSDSHPDPFIPSPFLNSSTPSSTTLNSSNSSNSSPRQRPLRRSATSTLSNSSDPSDMAEDPRIQRVRRTESLCMPSANFSGRGTRQTLKRAPSFGGAARDVRNNDLSSPYPSSDEEEKIRTKQAKKLRTKPGTPTPSPTATPPPPTPARTRSKPKETTSTASKSSLKSCSGSSSSKSSSTTTTSTKTSSSTAATTISSAKSSEPKPPPLRANLQRNPSIFGAELPHPQTPLPSTAATTGRSRQVNGARSTLPVTQTPRLPNAVSPPRTLRRVRATSFARAPARRISFGSLVAPAEESGEMGADGEGLGSAFQLR